MKHDEIPKTGLTIQKELNFWFLLVAVTTLVVISLLSFQQMSTQMELESFDKLTAIRDLKVQRIEAWVDERFSDLHELSYDIMLTDGAEQTLDFLKRFEQMNDSITDVAMIDPSDGSVIAGTNAHSNPLTFEEQLEHPSSEYVSQLFYGNKTDTFLIRFSIPFMLPEEGPVLLVSTVDMENSLYPMMLDTTGLGSSGETLIVDEDSVALNELRWYDDAPMRLKIWAEPAASASQGQTGIARTPDYRGVPVIAAYTYIPKSRWGFVAKQDVAELNAGITKMLRYYLVIVLITLSGITLLSLMISRRITGPLDRVSEAAQLIGTGDLEQHIEPPRQYELRVLSETINTMAESIRASMFIENSIRELTDELVDQQTVSSLEEHALHTLMEYSDADMAVFYTRDDSIGKYVPTRSFAVDPEELRSFDAESPAGILWKAVHNADITISDRDTTIISPLFHGASGSLSPVQQICIPMVIGSDVSALISLYRMDSFTQEAILIIEGSRHTVSALYGSVVSFERSKNLSGRLSQTNQRLESQAEELQEQTEELQNQAEELKLNSEELQEQNIELETQREQVEEASRLKSEFLSNMSHELRTPLNSIMALSQVVMMQAKDKLSDEETEYLSIVERNGRHLLNLINDILDISKIEAGKIEIHPSEVSLLMIVQGTAESLTPMIRANRVNLEIRGFEQLPIITTDESKLRQVLMNIMSNAVKFTEDGDVIISAAAGSDSVTISVRDTGIGIDQKSLPHIFDEFVQADGSTSRAYEGTGLGLAIAAKLMKNLGGSIEVSSILGAGTEFLIHLPLERESSNGMAPQLIREKDRHPLVLVTGERPEVGKLSGKFSRAGYASIVAEHPQEVAGLLGSISPYALIIDDSIGAEETGLLTDSYEGIPAAALVSEATELGFSRIPGLDFLMRRPIDPVVLLTKLQNFAQHPETLMMIGLAGEQRKTVEDLCERTSISVLDIESVESGISVLSGYVPDVIVIDGRDHSPEALSRLDKSLRDRSCRFIVIGDAAISARIPSALMIDPSDELGTMLDRMMFEPERIASKKNESSQKKILIVEDNQFAVIQIRKALESRGFQVLAAVSGSDALVSIRENRPDGMILDLMMPGMDGFEVLERVRSSRASSDLPVLILTAKDLTSEDLSRLTSCSIQQLIQKGDVDIDELMFKISLMLQNKPRSGIAHTPAKVPAGDRKRVLIVEDNRDNMVTMRAILGSDFEIFEASDGERGIQEALSLLPDIILLDISLPKQDGYSVAETLKADAASSHIPIIAVTAHAMKHDIQAIMSSGFDGCVAKPIDLNRLRSEMDRLMTETEVQEER